MAWETRNGRGSYYTRSVKRNGRVHREYLGTGEAAQLIARMDALRREQRETERTDAKLAEERRREQEQPLLEFCAWADLWLRVALLSAGYHRHQRGEWRQRRG